MDRKEIIMTNKVYNYKIKVSLRKDCKDYEELNAKLSDILNSKTLKLKYLGNNVYGTDDWSDGISVCQFLEKQDWFLDSAKELIWYNSDEGFDDNPESEDYYNETDWLKEALEEKYRS